MSQSKHISSLVAAAASLALCLGVVACGDDQEAPVEAGGAAGNTASTGGASGGAGESGTGGTGQPSSAGAGTAGTDSSMAGSTGAPFEVDLSEDYFPLVDGSTFSYDHGSWIEVVSIKKLDEMHLGSQVFEVSDTINPSDNQRSVTKFIRTAEGRVLRYEKTVVRDGEFNDPVDLTFTTYTPGFTRFSQTWITGGLRFIDEPEYERIEFNIASQVAKPAEQRKHTFDVFNADTSVDGYDNCVQIQRTKTWQTLEDPGADAQDKYFWFCKGVGKVREQNLGSDSYETLISCSIPGSTVCP